MAESLSALCGVIHNVIDELMPAGNFYVALLDEASGRLFYPYFKNQKESAREASSLSYGVPDDADSGGEWLGVPLQTGERATGAVVVETRSPDERYTSDDRDLLQFVSTQIATVIERARAQDRLRHMAHHDALSGLPNRPLFYDRLDVALKRARRDGEMLALLYVDLDNFKEVNDTWSHQAGDLVLQRMAKRLLGCVRESDTVARMGGDEFTMLLNNIDTPAAVEAARERIRKAMAQPFDLGDTAIPLTASVGLAVHPQDGEDAETLLRCADAGMYDMKRTIDA